MTTSWYSDETREAVAVVLADHFCDEAYYVSWERLPERNRDFYRAMADDALAAVVPSDRRAIFTPGPDLTDGLVHEGIISSDGKVVWLG